MIGLVVGMVPSCTCRLIVVLAKFCKLCCAECENWILGLGRSLYTVSHRNSN